MKWLALGLLAVFAVLLLVWRGPVLADGVLLNLTTAVSGTAVPSLAPLTTRGVCQQAHQTGRALLLQGQAAAAMPYLQTAVTCDTNRWAWFDLGRAQYALGQDEAAAESWQEADAYGYAARLAADARSRDDRAAMQLAWETAVQIDPQNGQAYVQLGNLVQEADPERAKAYYEQAIAADPDFAQAYFALGNYYRRQAQSPAQAQPYFEQAHQLLPQNVEYLSTLAQNTAQLDPMQAITYWQALVELAPNQQPGAFHSMGKLWLQAGDVTQAQHYLAQAVALRPENVEMWQTLAEMYEAAGCPTEAVAAYDEIIDLKPGTRQADNALARIRELEALATAMCPVTSNP